MKANLLHFTKIVFVLMFLNSCSNPEFDNVDPNNSTVLTNKTFDFSTYRQVKIAINDDESNTKYDIYAYADEPYYAGEETFLNGANEVVTEGIYRNDVINKLIFSGVPVNGSLVQTINVPKYCTKLYVRRNNNLNFSSSVVSILNDEASFNFNAATANRGTATELVNDYLFCVNTSKELFQINPSNGQLTFLSDMPMGSATCAIDQVNKAVYAIGNKSPYPLMKYSIVNNTWSTVKNLGTGGPRLDFNPADGLLYFSDNDKIYTINPTTGAMSAGRSITGLHQKHEGDLAFAPDGTIYLSTFSGVYRLILNASNVYQGTRINANNISFQPTSMTFDSSGNLWLANNSTNPDLIIMNTETGSFVYKYGKSAANNIRYKQRIDDLATFKVSTVATPIVDSDGDGVTDQNDAYPQDAQKAFELYTPSKEGMGTITFEDLWPSYGDYDFNDVALNYRATVILNAQNLAVEMDILCYVKVNGAAYTNGIGIEMSTLSPSQIQSVTGTVLTENYITVNGNGTEANQDHAVIILTDKANNLSTQRTIRVKFTQPISTSELGIAPFNPFIIVNKQRDREIHLPYAQPTTLGDNFFQIPNGTNRDLNGVYLSDEGMPWAMSFVNDFKVPVEKANIKKAYNYFILWANSGGSTKPDWYQDKPGYRNNDKLQD